MDMMQSSKFKLIAFIWMSCLFFLLFQGGKMAFMLFMVFSSIVLYLITVQISGIRGIQATRNIPVLNHKRIEAGSSIEVHLDFHVPGFIPIPYVLVSDRLRRNRGGEQLFELSFVPDWKRRGRIIVTTPPLQRGRYMFDSTACSVQDIFGLTEYSKKVNVPYSFTVYPRRVQISKWHRFNQMYRGKHMNSIISEVQQETTQFNGVREYLHGDPMSRIHWNASARTGAWKSKEYEREALPRMLIALDCSSEYKNRGHFETAVSTAASLLDFSRHSDLSVGLIISGQEPYLAMPQRSAIHKENLLTQLIDVERSEGFTIEQAVKARERELGSNLFMTIITSEPDSSMWKFIRWLKIRGIQCSVFRITPYANPGVQVWQKDMYAAGIPSYTIGALHELPHVLGGESM